MDLQMSHSSCDSSATPQDDNDNAYSCQADFSSKSQYLDHNQPVRPVPDQVWRGCFNITQTDYGLFEVIVAHLSNKACNKVFEEATTLPSMLSLEMHSKAHLWPNSFMHSMPSEHSIALYFFPKDTRIERDFERLVNAMIDKDLAMKTTAKNAELLIFTSKVLPQSYWRLQGNYYLWGVFRGERNDIPVATDNHNHVSSANSRN